MSSQSLFTHSQSFKQLPQKMDDSKNMKKKPPEDMIKDISEKAERSRRAKMWGDGINRYFPVKGPFAQICICLCTDCDFIANRYCLQGEREMM